MHQTKKGKKINFDFFVFKFFMYMIKKLMFNK